jgi:hypothetical protein
VAYFEISYEKGWTKAPAAVHGRLGITYHRNEKAKAIAVYLENENHERQVESRVQALLASVDENKTILHI